ncbi:MAG: DUF2270 domain-containing protein [Candidatus Eisenbacteria bacterium]
MDGSTGESKGMDRRQEDAREAVRAEVARSMTGSEAAGPAGAEAVGAPAPPPRTGGDALPDTSLMARRGFSGPDGTIMAHFYRGEMNRLTVWRSRMDVTTNWAIVATIGLLSLSVQNPNADSILLVNLAALWVLLIMESRRYRFYDVWRWRMRILEAHILAPIVSGMDRMPQGPWRHDLTADLLYPTFKISMAEAMGRRLLRNFYYLFLLVFGVSLGNVMEISPATSSWELLSREQLMLSLREHWLFLAILVLAYIPLILLAVLGWRRRKIAVELHDPGGRRPYRV